MMMIIIIIITRLMSNRRISLSRSLFFLPSLSKTEAMLERTPKRCKIVNERPKLVYHRRQQAPLMTVVLPTN